jgi:phosphoribosylformylglycinamidine cyclo-ligase
MHQLSKKILDIYTSADIHGMVHCSGGAKLKFCIVENLHIIKRIYFQCPLFQLIQEQSNTDWNEMYQVFNCKPAWSCMSSEAIGRDTLPFLNPLMSMLK